MADTNQLLPANTYTDATGDTEATGDSNVNPASETTDTTAVTDVSPVSTNPRHAAVDQVAATTASYADSTDGKGYTPTFGATTRTVVYITCGILGILGLLASVAALATGAPAWLTLASSAVAFIAPYIANMFGVAYNPLKMAGR